MPTFDGDNLIVTLDPVDASGRLEVDVFADLFSEWKDWMLLSPLNRRYPALFRSDGGGELTAIIDQGAYAFFNNTAGWRIKPYENDGDYYFVGNIAPENVNLPILKATDGAYTVGIFGLQPITQGVVPSMKSNLEQSLFADGVVIDPVNGVTGTGEFNSIPIGSRGAPSSNITDAIAISITRRQPRFLLLNSMTVNSADLSAGYEWVGARRNVLLVAGATSDFDNNIYRNLTFGGIAGQNNRWTECLFITGANVAGEMTDCVVSLQIEMIGSLAIFDCYAGVSPTIVMNGNELTARQFHGPLEITTLTAGDSTIGLTNGVLTLDSTCNGGTLLVEGEPYDVIDNSTGTVVTDATASSKVNAIHRAHYNRRLHDKTANTITIYDEDNVTPLHIFDADDDLIDISPQ